jgi:hypothetical protein
MRVRYTLIPAFLCLCAAAGVARAQIAQPDWNVWKPLLGHWAAEGGGQPGQSSGAFSFRFQLDGKILVRDSGADYPATKDRPAASHHDLMIVYPEAGQFRAIYFDSEGHVINYSVELRPNDKAIVFVSAAEPSAPRFRLTYRLVENERVDIRFEIAPPGKPDAFSTYVEGVGHRDGP